MGTSPSSTARPTTTSSLPNQPPTTTPYTAILSTGQSLSTGVPASATNDPTYPAPPHAYTLADSNNLFDITAPDAPTLRLAPLREPVRPPHAATDPSCAYPGNVDGRTPHSAFAAQVAAFSAGAAASGASTEPIHPMDTIHSLVGVSGAPMWDICKRGNQLSYAAAVYEARALTRLAREQGRALVYRCILMTHGETDAMLNHSTYDDELLKLQADFEVDLRAATEQDEGVVMLLTQQHASPPTADDSGGGVAQAQWVVQARSRGRVVCAGPKYQYGYADGLHLPGPGYDRLGEKYAQVYWQHVVQRRAYVPLSPTKVVMMRDRRTVSVSMHVPVPPMMWNLHIPAPHQEYHAAWRRGRGFEVRDARRNELAIKQVTVREDQVEVELEAEPDSHSLPLTLSYAMTAASISFAGGEPDGRVGQLCDSDPFEGAGAEVLRCEVKAGSADIRCAKGLRRRARGDRVTVLGGEEGQGQRAEQSVGEEELFLFGVHPEDSTRGKLTRPWGGRDGSRDLRFAHDHRNYCVAFALPVEAVDEP